MTANRVSFPHLVLSSAKTARLVIAQLEGIQGNPIAELIGF